MRTDASILSQSALNTLGGDQLRSSHAGTGWEGIKRKGKGRKRKHRRIKRNGTEGRRKGRVGPFPTHFLDASC